MNEVVQKSKKNCTYCRKIGHINANCFKRRNDEKRATRQKSINNRESSANIAATDLGQDLFSFTATHKKVVTSETWIADSGATAHMCHNREFFSQLTFFETSRTVTLGDANELIARGMGTVFVLSQSRLLSLKNVLWVENLHVNLPSTGAILDLGFAISETAHDMVISKDTTTVATASRETGSLWIMNFQLPSSRQSSTLSCKNSDYALLSKSVRAPLQVWHSHLGHASYAKIIQTARGNSISGLDVSGSLVMPTNPCEPCAHGKKFSDSFKENRKRAQVPGELLHFDTFSAGVPSVQGHRYGLLVVDDYSSLVAVFCLKKKSDAANALDNFLTFLRANRIVALRVRSDNACEYTSSEMRDVLLKH